MAIEQKSPARVFHWDEEEPIGRRYTVVACISPRCEPFTVLYAMCQVPREGFDDPDERAEMKTSATKECDYALDQLIVRGCPTCGQPFYAEVGCNAPLVQRKP